MRLEVIWYSCCYWTLWSLYWCSLEKMLENATAENSNVIVTSIALFNNLHPEYLLFTIPHYIARKSKWFNGVIFVWLPSQKKTLSIRGCETELLVNAAGDTGAISTSFMSLAACRSFGDEAVTLSWSAFGNAIACVIDISVMSNQWLRLEHPELRGWTCQL